MSQHLAARLQVGREQVTVNAAVHGAVNERVGQITEPSGQGMM